MRIPTEEINGFALRVIRERTGTSLSYLADATEIDPALLSKYERGIRITMPKPTYVRVLKALGIEDYRVLLADPNREPLGYIASDNNEDALQAAA